MSLIHELPLIEWVINSCKLVSGASMVILAIPNTDDCNVLENVADRLKMSVLEVQRNVLGRYLAAASIYKLDYVVKLQGMIRVQPTTY